MNILWVTPEWPYPPDQGGRARMLNLLRELSRLHSISLVSIADSHLPDPSRLALQAYVQDVHVVYHPNSPVRTFLRIVRSLMTGYPYILYRYCPPSLRSTISRWTAERRFDIVLLSAHYLTDSILRQSEATPVVVDFHDLTHILYARFAQQSTGSLKAWHSRMQYARMRKFEANIPHRVSACTMTSPEDALILSRLSGASNIHVVPNGVDTNYYSPIYTALEDSIGCDIVFVGSFDYAPNVQGARFLCREVMPLVWNVLPEIQVGLVGRDPLPSVQRLAHDSRVRVTGRVDDVRPYLFNSKVVVVPLQVGGGTRLKILEAMAMARSVVSTAVGCEGIQARDGIDIVIADSARDMANALVTLLNNTEHRRRIGEAGRYLVETTYDWSAIGQGLNALLHSLVPMGRPCE